MGDFNVDPKCYEQSLHTNGSFHWKYNIINKLYAQNMFDTVDLCQDITPQTPFDTYIPNQQNQTSSCIDQIWISEELVTDTITSSNYVSDLYNSDHRAVYISFFTDNIFSRKGVASLKQHNMRKCIFTYDEMTSEKWSKFQQDIDTEYNNSNLKDMYINTPSDLNRYWDNIRRIIITAAKSNIDNHMTSVQHKDTTPEHLMESYRSIKRLNRLLSYVSPKSFPHNSNEINKDWNRRSRYITELTSKHHYKDLTIPLTLNNNNIVAFRHGLKKFHRVLQHKHSLLYAQHNNEQIRKFIQQRCEDYHGNQSHMIDSFLAREKRTIVIDKVLQTVNNHQTLVTDPTEIKRITNTHFQTCPGGIHEEKTIPDQWKQQYTPSDSIDGSIYTGLMNPPTESEWNEVIHNLPKHKAAGPSQISNEMLQNLSSNMSTCIWKYISACLQLNDIPDAWREARIYPIPKPKEWECNLTNTRPITLLETIRKALVRLLNNRLATLMVQHNILKGNQFAGVPGSSTFEPIRIINEIIEDAREKDKEIWILFQDLSKAYDRVNIHMLDKALKD